MENTRNKKRWTVIMAISILVLVLVIIAILVPSKTEEEKVIEISKEVFDKYAPDYTYLDSPENWLVRFNDADGNGSITVWAPSDEPNSQGVFLRGCVMFERQTDGIMPFYVEIDHEERYRCDRENDIAAQPTEQPDADENESDYSDISELFSSVVPDSEIKVNLRNGKTLHTKIKTQLSSESAPEGWPDTLAAFGEALAAADEKKGEYGASTASAEILSSDEIILSSGYNAKVQFNKFAERDLGESEGANPPTISKFEYDQISVGMTLSQVREIVGGDGTLESSVGTAGVTSTVHTYRFSGEKEGSYADILFDDYVVYSKIEVWLD